MQQYNKRKHKTWGWGRQWDDKKPLEPQLPAGLLRLGCLVLLFPSSHKIKQVNCCDNAKNHLPLAGLAVAVILNLFMYHQSKVIYFQNVRQLPQIVLQVNLLELLVDDFADLV